MKTELGKITHIEFGIGGAHDSMIGLATTLEGRGWGVGDYRGFWNKSIQTTKYTEWSEAMRRNQYANIIDYIADLLIAADVKNIQGLIGKPVEATFDGNALHSWRLLTEVL